MGSRNISKGTVGSLSHPDSLAYDNADPDAIFFDEFGNPLPRPKKEPEPDNADNEPAPEENADAIKED